jgi:Flp pilus assembly protein TadD
LMAAGCLLALVPTVIILTGLAACARKFFRHPEPIWFLLLGLPVTTLAALVYMNLKLPFYCNVKAFYGLMALLPICAFGAFGWDILIKQNRVLRPVLCVALGVWALNAYASFWIRDGAASTHATRGMSLAGENGRRDDAIKELSEALRLDPHNSEAKVSLAVEWSGHEPVDKSVQLINHDLMEHPGDANGHLQLASILAGQGQLEPAIQHAERALMLGPDYADPYHHLCAWFTQLGRNRQALIVGREGLRLKPMDPELHYLVACALVNFTNHLEAIQHFHLACAFRPGWAEAHDQMGSSMAALGRWQEAANQFGKACNLKPTEAAFHYHLALAYTTTGLFAKATASATKAIELGHAAGDAALVARNQKLLEFCRSKSAEHGSDPTPIPNNP